MSWSRATGADGRERQHTDKAAEIIKEKLEKNNVRVKIVKPEDFCGYSAYDSFIQTQSRKGVKVIPLHFDALGGTFLTRVRSGDKGDLQLAGSISRALGYFQIDNRDLGKFRDTDTVHNHTVHVADHGPAVLVEMGVMVDWERQYGSNFTQTKKFDQFANYLVEGIMMGSGFHLNNPEIIPPTGWNLAK